MSAAHDSSSQAHAGGISERRYEALIEAIDEGFCVVEVEVNGQGRGRDYRFLEVNPAFRRLTGIPDAVGHSMRELAPAHEQHWFDRYAEVALTGKPIRFEREAQALAGGRWFDVFAFRVDDPADRHVAILFSDVTERRQIGRTLRENERRLADAAAALQAADRRKDDFLATLAHELRNPLAPIRNGIEVLRIMAAPNAALDRTTQMMARQMQHLVRLVDDLLDVSRITRGKIQLRRQRVAVNHVVGLALESCETLFAPHGHCLSVTLSSEPMIVRADADRLRQVFSNLLSNAAKFTPPGGKVWVAVERSGDFALVRIRDTGVGIPRERLSQVFEMFAQVECRHANDGLGIGLALAKELVLLHGGFIEARSEGSGKGSEFIVCLPLADVDHPNDVIPHIGLSGAATTKRVLVVDDNVDAAESLAQVLRLHGHEAHTAGGGVEAVAVAARELPDVIFMDLGMPGMDGLTAARLIREQPGGASIRIVALTGWGQDSDRERTRAAGIEEHLVKPVSPEALLALFGRD
jgi:PAS domain S-box-containing protein